MKVTVKGTDEELNLSTFTINAKRWGLKPGWYSGIPETQRAVTTRSLMESQVGRIVKIYSRAYCCFNWKPVLQPEENRLAILRGWEASESDAQLKAFGNYGYLYRCDHSIKFTAKLVWNDGKSWQRGEYCMHQVGFDLPPQDQAAAELLMSLWKNEKEPIETPEGRMSPSAWKERNWRYLEPEGVVYAG